MRSRANPWFRDPPTPEETECAAIYPGWDPVDSLRKAYEDECRAWQPPIANADAAEITLRYWKTNP
jgi:hypothetical protein